MLSEESKVAMERRINELRETAAYLEACIAVAPNEQVAEMLDNDLKSITGELEAIPKWPIFVKVIICGGGHRSPVIAAIGAHYQRGRYTRYGWVRQSFAEQLGLEVSPAGQWDSFVDDIPCLGQVGFAVEIEGCHVGSVWANVAADEQLEHDIALSTVDLGAHRIKFKDGAVDVSEYDPNVYL